MGHTLIKLTHKRRVFYLDWSSVVDAPVTYGMSLAELRRWYRQEFGHQGMLGLPARLARIAQTGTSSFGGETPAQVIIGNRAGPHESDATLEEIIRWYCLREPGPNGWHP